MQDILDAILILEALFIGMFVLFLIIGNILCWVGKKLNPHYPFCDIDSRCHIGFAWDKNGNGWIGNHMVVLNVEEGIKYRKERIREW